MRGLRSLLLVLALTACGSEAKPSSAPTTPAPVTTTAAASAADIAAVLRDAAVSEESYSVDNQTYTTDVSQLLAQGMKPNAGVTFRVISASRTAYCLSASAGGRTLYYTSTVGTISATACH